MERTPPKQRFESDLPAQPKRRRIDYGKKNTHNKCEQKGRQKINDKINELKELLPECQSNAANKAAVLRSAADSIKRFQYLCYQLFTSNMKLDEENNKIREEITRLRGLIGLPTEATTSIDMHRPEPLIKPELVDPSRFISTNHIPIRQDPFAALYTNSVDISRSFKIMPGGSLYTTDSGHFSDDSSPSDKDPVSSPEEDTYNNWK